METIDERIKRYIEADEDGISVNWGELVRFKNEQDYSGRHLVEAVEDGLVGFLLCEGFLVHARTKKSYAVVGDGAMGANIGPPYSTVGVNFNFKRIEDARVYKEFAGKFHGAAVLPASIIQILE
jgi:hypothetical protein